MSAATKRARRATARVFQIGGTQVARINRFPNGHAALLLSIYILLPILFDPKWAEGVEASFELRIPDPEGDPPDVSTVVVRDGRCRIIPRPDPDARVTVTIGADDIVRMASGAIGWPQLVSAQRMVLWGDPYLALRFPLLFGLPAARGEPALFRLAPTRQKWRQLRRG